MLASIKMKKEISIFDEEKIIKIAEKQLETQNHLRKIPFVFALVYLGMCLWVGSKIFSKLQNLPAEELTKGFITGFALSIVASTFGVIGAICLTKALIGFADDFKAQELLLIYHKRLYEKKKRKQSEPKDALNSDPAVAKSEQVI